jgi:hypothetical protein
VSLRGPRVPGSARLRGLSGFRPSGVVLARTGLVYLCVSRSADAGAMILSMTKTPRSWLVPGLPNPPIRGTQTLFPENFRKSSLAGRDAEAARITAHADPGRTGALPAPRVAQLPGSPDQTTRVRLRRSVPRHRRLLQKPVSAQLRSKNSSLRAHCGRQSRRSSSTIASSSTRATALADQHLDDRGCAVCRALRLAWDFASARKAATHTQIPRYASASTQDPW